MKINSANFSNLVYICRVLRIEYEVHRRNENYTHREFLTARATESDDFIQNQPC